MTEPTVRSETAAATVAGLLRTRAAERPEQVAFTFLTDGESEGGRLTYAELDRRAAAIAAALAAAVPRGERALLLYPPGLDFIAAFFGCLYAGVVAVPAYPPRPNDRSQSRLRSIAHDATPRAALTTAALLAGVLEPRGLLAAAPELAGLRWIPTDALEGAGVGTATYEPDPESVAFLQYTSGSTAAPKGVMVTHANLLHNERMIGAAFGMDEESVVVGWLPLYHDMGLIGNVLQPLHAGGRCVLMSPVAFLQRPMRWLEAISRYRGTTSGGPNFAYELCARKASPEALGGLDLSSWRLAFNGAEPVRASTLERFAATFAPCGFRREAFYPCYGLAEATLLVTGGQGGRAPRVDATTGRVSCGRAWMGQRVVVADPETGAGRPAGTEGEIWVSGPSVARGYWENPETTAHDFNAFLDSGEGPFLRTGDLGVLSGGELYVTGRLKDLIILRGRNHYPQDIELTAERSHPDLRPGGGAAFSVEVDGEERLVVVHEVERRRRGGIEEIAEAVRRAVAAEHEVQVHEVVLIRQGGLPKTSSGKVQRRRCRELYRRGELPVVGRSALAAAEPAPEIASELTRESLTLLEPAERRAMLAAYLRERAAAVLGIAPSAVSAQPLTALGLDSLTAVELKGGAEAALGLPVPLADLLQGIGVEELADRVLAGLESLETPAADAPPLRALSPAGDQPLSAGQRGLWFLHRLAPEGGAYNIAVAARTRGLDAAAFARALSALVERHEALRTVFPVAGDEPVQRVLAALPPDFQIEDVGAGLVPARLAEEAWRPFSLERGPLLRARIFKGEDGETILLAVHHIVADFASLAVIARDLSALYRQEALEPLALRYADYVHWQAGALAGPRGERLWSYWRQRLAGVRDLDLPADRPRPPVQTDRGGARAAAIPPDLAAALRALAAGRRATPFMVLLAAFQAQLARYTGQEDFAVGAPVAGRARPELEGLVGYFVNALPLRADLSGEPGFERLLARTRRTALEGMEHGDLPFPRIAEGLRPVRDPARSPVFQVLLVLQTRRPQDPPGLAAFSLGEGGARLDLAGLALESVRLEERRAQFDLTLRLAEDDRGGLGASLEYNAGLFDGATAERMLGHFLSLLAGGVAAPATSVWHLPLLAPAERRQVIEAWNATAREDLRGAPGLLLHQLFEAAAAGAPEAEAVVAGELRLSYGELNARANRLARRLRRLGVGPEERVGICLRRSERMIVALLAVLKAGGAYVPLDPAYPRERLAWMLEDSAARVVIGEAATESLAASGGRWLSLDAEGAEIAAGSAGDLAPVAGAGNLAYLIYTSGSTGRPKAVAVEHRSPVALMGWAREAFPPEELAGTLAATSIGFDVSVFEIFAPLSWGGRIVVAEDLLAWPGLPAAGEVRLVCGVPSVVAELVRAGRFPGGVRTVNLAGEAVPPALVAELAAAAPGARLLDIYGPSEDTVYATWARLEPGGEVTIGAPLANTRAHLLDPRGEPVPVGVPGELCLAGAGLARGYLGRPELTAERFVPDPFAASPGERLYRTGDLARRRADGLLEYLGRVDLQVKIRGFRVELGEVEAALARHPRLREAVVVAREDGDRGRRLVAYVAPASRPGEITAEELRGFLRESLPDYMIPAAFVGLDALPLSPNGKVDRSALPDPSPVAPVAVAAFRSPAEEMLAGVVAEVLGVERVGAHDDFFALGGHSLLATRLLARVSRLFGVDLPVSAVFLHPTVAALAGRLAEASGGLSAMAAPPVRPVPRLPGGEMPLSFAQRRLWFLERLEPGSPVYHLPGAVGLAGPLDLAVLESALAEVVHRHEALRTVFRGGVGEPVQVVTAAGASLPRIDLAALPAAVAAGEAERLARASAVAPFDLERGPLWRALAVRLAPEEHILALTLHHLVADGWSLGILLSELAALYAAFAAGRPSPFPELPVQYADWAAWQRDRLRGGGGGALEGQVAWWREQLAGVPVLELPADRPRAAVRSARGGTRAASLPAALTAELERLARREGATPFMLLLAAFQSQLARYTGAPSVPVGSPVANRGRAEVEGVIGFFVNMLVLRTPVAGDPAFRELLARVREVCLGAYAHQEVPFERLVEVLRPERQRGRNPLFQVAFQMEEPLAVERLGAAAVAVRALETGTAKFDLMLSLARGAEGLAATLEYDADLFDPATADRLLGHWRTLAAGIAVDPGARLSDLPLLTAAEGAQIRAWNGFAAEYPREATVHGLFAAQARRSPAAVALEAGGERLSYAGLEARANRLARRLRRLGVGPEVPVGLCLERSAELIVAMLGVLKAGGAYVPLDPAYPAERLAFLTTDTGCPLVVIPEGLEAALPPGLTRVPLAAGGELAEGPEESAEPLPDLVGPEGLAYVVYTSGSTGRPKGVEAVHRAVVRLVRGTGYAPFGPDEVFLHLAPPSFDAATYEVWGALLNGGRLAVLPGRAPSLAELADALERHGVTAIFLSTGLFHQMVELRLDGLRGLRSLLAGGDVISPELMRRAVEGLPGCRVADVYGPTENTTFSTCQPLPAAAGVVSPVPIGRPIANSTVHLLDADLRPVPAGVAGELYTGGDGLARGYRGRPELTAERFVPHPFPSASAGGERLYRTGDVARWRPDGAIEFLGRRDQQVKIRGFRVEPAEVEAVLARHPGVADVAVVVREERGGKALVAYVVPRAGDPLPADLREHLRAGLPEYMRPAYLISLPELPLNANAKVDRRALAARAVRPAAEPPAGEAPRSAVEERLAAIWSEVLGVERVGLHDDFFELGGHSLLAIRTLARIGEAFGVDLPVGDLFAAPTVAGLAERLAAGPREEIPVAAGSLAPRPAPGSHAPASEPPRTPLEERLAAIWREVLEVERIGVHDDFFDLGGHSLLAIRVLSRIHDRLGVAVPMSGFFAAPTVAGLAERLAGEHGEGAAAARPEGDLSALAVGTHPLSFAQQRLWLLDLIEPGSPKYNVPIAARLQGPLEIGALVGALAEIVRRHEPLRTVYAQVDEEPVQVVLPPPAPSGLAFARADLAGLSAPARDRALREALRAEGARPFDLARGPVVRFLLLDLGAGERVLMAAFHHIAVDGWSMEVFFRELAVLYGDLAAGRPSSLPELPVRYADWAVWQRRTLAAGALASQLAYWRRQLAGVPVLELPADRPRTAATGDRGASRPAVFPADLAGRLRGLGSGEGITAFTVLLSGFAALLARLSGQDDLAVGLTSAGRGRLSTEGLIGFFVNTLVARARVEDDPAFGALARRTRDTLLAAQRHQDVPFERLVDELQPERVAGVTPLFQAAFTYLASPLSPVPMPGLAVELLDIETAVSKFDLTLSVYESGGRLSGWVEYRAGLFDPATVERWMESLRGLLEAAAADPSRRLSELPLLGEAGRWQVVGEWNATDLPLPLDRCLHELVEAQVARAPDAPAVVAEDGELTYRELDDRAERLARRLRRLGVGPEVAVGLFVERSAAMIVAVLGILKAGGAYVPLDPGYPGERLAGMLADTAVPVLLAPTELAGKLPPHGARLLLLDRQDEMADAVGPSAAPRATAANLASVIFTSGSTGRPKGVMLPHRGLVNRLLWAQGVYRLTPADAVLLKAACGFDFAIWECFAPLLAGARLVVARPGGHRDARYLARTIAEHGVTLVHFVPSMLEVFLDEEGALECRSLRQVFSGGEALSPALRDRFLARFPGVPLDNQYGPTEISIDTTRWVCAPGQDPRRVSLGRPIANTRIHLLDRALRPVPIGAPGLLHVGGTGVARGYHGRPDLTAERFVPDPEGRGGRLYDTGDLARRLPDGTLEFLGRADQQVKVRGVRIEPGEVEAALLLHPAVAAAAVGMEPGGARLIAWVVPSLAAAPAETAPALLRDFLSGRLPETMIPSQVVRLEALPLTPSGKLDRRALPAPEAPATGDAGDLHGATPVEELLAGLWSALLGVEAVGVHDGFFDLGGHSLLAIQAISRVREAFGVELAPAELFAAPTPAALARRIAQLRGEGGSTVVAPRPGPRDPAGEPLSFAQERLWFLHRLEPESSAYNVAGALRLRGSLAAGPLAHALGEIARRHEALRTVFRETAGGVPVQIILPPSAAPLPVVDLSALPGAAEEAARWLAGEARRPFDLAAGPLVRALLLRLGDEDHLLAVVMHHVISDAWSLRILLRELAALYPAFAAGEPSPLPELPLQYADFARWQREQLAGERLEGELAHWRRALGGAPETLELPTDRPRPAAPTFAAGRVPFALPPALAADLRALARRQGWTPFMVLLAAFDALLARVSGQLDLVVGVPVANRNRLETERVIGFFTNTLALRLDLAGDPSFHALARRARAATLEAYAHQELPFERLVEELAPHRERGGNPLFQAMLALNDVPVRLELPGIDVAGVELEPEQAKFDLTLFLAADGGGFGGHLEIDRDLFDLATAERLTGHLLTLLAGAVAVPETALSRLPLLTPAERGQLAAWSRPPRSDHRPWCVHERVAERAALHPEAEAVAGEEGETLTYGELLRRSRRLAARLRQLGVGPDVPVGVFLERSPGLAVAILGVLAAGGAVLPLDPGYPRERLRLMLDDARVPVVLTQGSLAGALPDGDHRPLRIEEALAGPDPAGGEAPAAVDPGNLIYLIYTSGSTGRPKGVAMTHGALSAMLDWQLRTSRAGAGRTLQFAALSFDVAFQEMFSAWCAGGSVVMVSDDVRRDPPALLRLLAERRVERLFLPFVALQQLALAARPGELPASLREVMTAGEQLYVTPQVAALFAQLPGAVLYNHYGPAETHVVTWLPLEGDPAGWPERPGVGGPVDHARVFLLDGGLQPVPVGVAGEIWLGGPVLARGYLGQPGLTAERFLPDPFEEIAGWEPGSRLYRTGDLARRLPGGEIDYLGRRDAQVKVRGQRIEPAEVEAALARHPAVRQAAVAVRGAGSGSRRLVGYVVFREEAVPPAPAELRAFLAASLPDAMVPTLWVRLAELPLTPSGKVDRRALPAPAGDAREEAAFLPPRDPAEEILAEIWREILGVRRVGAHDDFFELGGHSLLATQVMSRLREAFGVELPLRRLFEGPTVAELARAVEAALAADAPAAAEPIIPRVSRDGGAFPLSFAQERLWFLDRMQPGSTVYSLPLFLRLDGELDVAVLAAVLGEIARRHEALRTVFAERDGGPVQVVLPPDGRLLPEVDLRALPTDRREREATRLAADEAARPFDLARGPLLRTALLRLSGREHRLLLNMHHIVSDGWSLGVLTREIGALHAAVREGRPSPLPELPAQYADFAVWQRRWLAGEALERQLGYWRERLRGLPAELELPGDRPRPALRSQRGAEHRFRLDDPLMADLLALARREGATAFMVLAASMLALLSRLSGQHDLAIGTPIANRNHRETEGLIGFFINTLVLRAELAGVRGGFLGLVRQVRETALGAYAHQDLPFERLIDELHPERDPSRTPLFQVMFALQNMPLPAVALPGLALTAEEPASRSAKFDLALVLSPDGGGLAASIEYATDLFDPATMARFAGHWRDLLAAAAAAPEAPLASLPLLSAAQRRQVLREWNDTARSWEDDPALHQLFERQVDLQPGAPAGICRGETITYAELEARANRLAHHLRTLGVGRSQPVGLWMGRSLDLLAAVLGILKAGGTYVPLDAAWPAERVERILAGTGARTLLAGRELLPAVVEMQWRLPALRDVVCPEEAAPEPPPEPLQAAAVSSLWDWVAERATDRVTAAGFYSAYTGQPFSAAEVDEYRDRVLALAAPWLGPQKRVLEIGCGSGLILWELARRAGRAVGLDPSERTQEKNRETARNERFGNVELVTGFAHEIADWPAGSFDLIVLASTVQFFPGPFYLQRVLGLCLRLLAPGGALLVADVLDARRQEELRRSLAAAAAPARVRTHAGDGRELILDEGFFRDLPARLPEIAAVAVHPRREGFANELRLRYDVVLTRGGAGEDPPVVQPARRLTTGWHMAQAPAGRPEPVSDADDLAYLIHTSGSTGEPKGILIRHRPAVNTLRWNNETFGIGPADRHLFVNSICFDLSIQDILGMLGAGAAVRVATEEELRDPERLAAVLRDEGITTWNSAPVALQRLVPFFPPPGEGRLLRCVLLAGDWIPLSLPDLVWTAFPQASIENFGGATETSVWSNWYHVGAVDPAWAGIPYGRPLANALYYVLDAGLEPCPPGVPGDLYIGGDCLAVGYAGAPTLTAERFLPDPHSEEPGARLYATGDRARFWGDGVMEFLGRIDLQVKVRGYRIELGEIESALARHPGVREAVVLAREDVPGEKRLVGYVVPSRQPASTPAELRAFLQETLPEYMVPWAFVELATLPVTANGKLDREALPAPREVRPEGTAAGVAPRNDLERAIAAVWRDVLQLDAVGVEENFFEVGGSSLLLARLQSRLRQATGREIPFVELFRHPTIESLARSLEGGAPPPEEKAEVARARTETRRESMRQLQQARGQRRARKGES